MPASCFRIRPLAALLVLLLAATAARADVPRRLGFQGRLTKADGSPDSGILAVTFAVYDAETGGSKLWEETQNVALTDGFYSTFLGAVTPLGPDLFAGGDRYLQLTVGGEDLLPRQKVGSVAYALLADTAKNLRGGTVDATSISVNGVTVIDAGGHLAGNTSYVAGSGIAIDAVSNTISLANGCAQGEVLKWSGTQWACGAASEPLVAGAGLVFDGNTVSMLKSCAAGEMLRWNGSTWACSTDGSVTNVQAASPLQVANGSTTPTLSIPRASAVSDGYLAASDYAAFATKLDGTSTAAGDVTGTFDALTVGRIQGRPVASGAPVNGQVLKWNGSQWAPAADTDTNAGGTVTSVTGSGPIAVANGSTTPAISIATAGASTTGALSASDWSTFNGKLGPASTAGGDVSGTFSALTVGALQGHALASTAPVNGQVLKWNGTQWAPAADANAGGTVTSVTVGSGPLSIVNNTTTPAISLAQATSSTSGYLSAADWTNFNAKLGSGSAAGGDLSGTLPNPTVAKLQGLPVTAITPAAGQVLKWSGAAWVPGNDLNSGGTVTGVSGAGPIAVSNGSTTPTISIANATSSAAGAMSPTDKTNLDAIAAQLGCTGAGKKIVGTGTGYACVDETDPKVATLTGGQLCRTDGSKVYCDTSAPSVDASGNVAVSGTVSAAVPTANAHVATKAYVDTTVTAAAAASAAPFCFYAYCVSGAQGNCSSLTCPPGFSNTGLVNAQGSSGYHAICCSSSAATSDTGTSGYLVVTQSTYTGNLGGLTGADAKCLAELNSANWLGKGTVALSSTNVHALLCNDTTCNNLRPGTRYYFARAGNFDGGGSFTTDRYGRGPGDNTGWYQGTVFNESVQWWSNRASASTTYWQNAPSTATGNSCSNWSTTGGNGGVGYTAYGDSNRWGYSSYACSISLPLLCYVDPP